MAARTPTIRLMAGLVVATLLAGCAGGGAVTPSPPTPTPTLAPTPTPTPGVAYVRGTSTCEVTSRPVGTTGVIRDHFHCMNDTNDPRVNGQADYDFVTTFDPADSPAARWVGDLTISNPGGTWHGKGAGAVVLWPSSDAGYPGLLDYGVDVYTGSGGYAGLTYHEFIGAATDEAADISGWIEPTP
jgi:hypothetical protein